MTDSWNQPEFDEDHDEGGEGKGKNPVRDRMRKLEKENADLRKANEKLTSQTRQSSVETLLEAAKVKHAAKVAGLVPANVEATAEAVKQWLDTYADVFSIQTDQTDDAKEGEGSAPEPDPEKAEQAEKLGRIGKATSATSTPTKQADLLKQVAGAKNREELLALVQQAGGGFGMG
jgi:hypothetical protein